MTNPSRRVVAGLLALFGLIGALELWHVAHQAGPGYSDFFGLWSWGRFVVSQGTSALYDPVPMHRFQYALDPIYLDQYYPYLYPPTYLLFLWPLAHLPLGLAHILWSASTAGAYLLAICGLRWRPSLNIAALVSPATILCLIWGQNGLLTAALMLGGLRCASSRPILAGVLLGLLTYKPHFALLVPVALIAARLWPTLLAMIATAALCVAITILAFGAGSWGGWLAAQRASWATIDAFIAAHLSTIPTVSAALRQLGLDTPTVLAGQVAAMFAAAVALWIVWRRRDAHLIMMPIAALLATPYASLYDLPMLSGAALLALERDRSPLAVAFIGSALLLPQLMFNLQAAPLPLAAPLLSLMLIWRLLPLSPQEFSAVA